MEKCSAYGLCVDACLRPIQVQSVAQAGVGPEGGPAEEGVVYQNAEGQWFYGGQPLVVTYCEKGIEQLIALLEHIDPILVLNSQGLPRGLATRSAANTHLLRTAKRAVATLEALLQTSSESICAIDEQGIVTLWNTQAEQRYHIPRGKIVGREVQDFFSNLLITKVQYNAMTSGNPVRDQYHQPMLGEHVLTNASPIVDGRQVWGAVTAERDITETMRLSNELARSNTRVDHLRREIDKYSRETDSFELITGNSHALSAVVDMARRIAKTDVSILLRGESGTGKELFAEAIHKSGKRHDQPFVVINCGAIPANLFESELFGYQPGAFTGADKKGHKGKFDEANHGTLFLDEIGELPLDMQVKLLRVLQNQQFYRVGGGEPVKVDVRLISATNRDLQHMIAAGQFRDDLYYRINVVSLELPPLRDRKEDIHLLAYQFLREVCLKQGIPVKQLRQEVLTCLINYAWPGNVRELRNVIERLVVLSDGNEITKDLLPATIKLRVEYQDEPFVSGSLQGAADKAEKAMLLQALATCQGDRSRTAKFLGIPRSTLYYKLKKYGIGRKNNSV